MTYSVIQKSQLEGAFRLDAEYYQPEYLRLAQSTTDKSRFVNIKSLGLKCDASAFYPALEPYYGQGDLAFVRVADVAEGINYDGILTVPKEIIKRYKTLNLGKKGDIVITKGGSIARVGLVQKDSALTRDLIFFDTSKLEEDDYIFFYVYCLTNFYRGQLLRSASMTAQPHLTTTLVKDIPFFDLTGKSKLNIVSIFKRYTEQLESSKKSYQQAEDLLMGELDLRDFVTAESLFSIVNFSDVQKSNRLDADFFQAKYLKLIKNLKDLKSQPLEKGVQIVPAKFNPYAEPDKEFKYVELSNIDSSLGIIDGASTVLGKEAASRAKRKLVKGDVIVSSVEGSLGKIALVENDREGFLASTGFFQFRSKEILPEVLLVLAKSIVFQYQLQQRCAGTILTAVPQDSIKDILIPVLQKKTQLKIAELVQKSHTARQKSRELLEEAKRKVEEMIEKGGD